MASPGTRGTFAHSLAQLARAVARRTIPEGVRRRIRRRWGWQWFRGDYATWAEACAASSGYGEPAILDRVLTATLAVQDGRAEFERDSVLFHERLPDEPLLCALHEVWNATGRLRVLDFGGSLGSTYWRHRRELAGMGDVRWDVVEQPAFVAAGRQHLREERLRFFEDAREAEAAASHDVLLCSCVLQYLPDPQSTLAGWRAVPIPFLLLNNLPLDSRGPDRLRVQHVPPSIYPASYPVWFFNRAAFLARLEPHYTLVREFASEAVWPVDRAMFPSTGLLLKKSTV